MYFSCQCYLCTCNVPEGRGKGGGKQRKGCRASGVRGAPTTAQHQQCLALYGEQRRYGLDSVKAIKSVLIGPVTSGKLGDGSKSGA